MPSSDFWTSPHTTSWWISPARPSVLRRCSSIPALGTGDTGGPFTEALGVTCMFEPPQTGERVPPDGQAPTISVLNDHRPDLRVIGPNVPWRHVMTRRGCPLLVLTEDLRLYRRCPMPMTMTAPGHSVDRIPVCNTILARRRPSTTGTTREAFGNPRPEVFCVPTLVTGQGCETREPAEGSTRGSKSDDA